MSAEIQPTSSTSETSPAKPEQPKSPLREKMLTAGKWLLRAAVLRGLGKLWDWVF
jgi:hypothetical protein